MHAIVQDGQPKILRPTFEMVSRSIKASYAVCRKTISARPFITEIGVASASASHCGIHHADFQESSSSSSYTEPVVSLRKCDGEVVCKKAYSLDNRLSERIRDISVIEACIRNVSEATSRRAEVGDVLRFLLKQYDTLSLCETISSLTLIKRVRGMESYRELRSKIQANLTHRLNYLVANSSDVSDSELVLVLRLCCDSFFRSPDFTESLRICLSRIDPNRLIQDLPWIHRLRNLSSLQAEIRAFLSSIKPDFRPVSLEATCCLIDLMVTCAFREHIPAISRLVDTVELNSSERFALYRTIRTFSSAYYIWDLASARRLVIRMVEQGIYPSKTTPTVTHLVIAVAMARIGGLEVAKSRNAYTLVERALLFQSDDIENILKQIEICQAFRLPARRSIEASPRKNASEAAERFLKRLKTLDDPVVVVKHVELLDGLKKQVKPQNWLDWYTRIVDWQETGQVSVSDLVSFMAVVENTSKCPDTVRATIGKSMHSLVLMGVRNLEHISRDVFDAVMKHDSEVFKIELFVKLMGKLKESSTCVDSIFMLIELVVSMKQIQSPDTVSLIRNRLLAFISESRTCLTNNERVAIVRTLLLRDDGWNPLVEFALDGLEMRSVTIQQMSRIGEALSVPSCLSVTSSNEAWKQETLMRLLPVDKQRFNGMPLADVNTQELVDALNRKLSVIEYQRMFPDGPEVNPLSSVKAFCGLFLTLSATASMWLDSLV